MAPTSPIFDEWRAWLLQKNLPKMIKHKKNYAKVGKKEQNKDKNNNNNKIAYQQGIQNYSTGPNICSRPVVTFPSYHLQVVQLNLFFVKN